jgi:hypothetical protein
VSGRREVPAGGAAFEYLWRNLVEMEMRHRGYSDAEIELASRVPAHTDECEFDMNTYAWDCSDEEGKSHHPIADEYDDLAGIIGRALERVPEAND